MFLIYFKQLIYLYLIQDSLNLSVKEKRTFIGLFVTFACLEYLRVLTSSSSSVFSALSNKYFKLRFLKNVFDF